MPYGYTVDPPNFDVAKITRPLLDSTTTNLAGGATYTGESKEVKDLTQLTWHVFASTETTVKIEQSMDGTNWDVVDSFTVAANTKTRQSVIPVVGTHVRLVVVNNDALNATTTLRAYLYGRAL